MTNTIYLLNYNNYYNREFRKESSLDDYFDYVVATSTSVNFTTGDHISTNIVVNISDDTTPDYVLVVESNEIVSRWFILESQRIRGGQYNLTLYRDTIADFYDDLLDAKCFIEKANLTSVDPFIYNSEDISVNRIKTQEILLKDKAKAPWLVIYYQKNTQLQGTVPQNSTTSLPHKNIGVEHIEDWPFYNPTNGAITSGAYNINARTNVAAGQATKFTVDMSSANVSTSSGNFSSTLTCIVPIVGPWPSDTLPVSFNNYGLDNLRTLLNNAYTTTNITAAEEEELLTYTIGDILKTTSGEYWEITAINVSAQYLADQSVAVNSNLYVALSDIIANTSPFSGTPNEHSFSTNVNYYKYSFTLVQREDLSITYDIPDTDKITTEDAPYDICAIPYADLPAYFPSGTSSSVIQTSNKKIGLATASAMIKNHGSLIYDVQLLPYCPIPSIIGLDGTLYPQDKQYTYIIDNATNAVVSYILHVPKSQFSFFISADLPEFDSSAMGKKVDNECTQYRLCSPNFNGYFDFSVAKNNGLNYFNVDCHYKPYSPYIHINPDFKNLYGRDFNDPRGLICGGDFSITQIQDQWQQYQLQNKNYQEIFDRNIQNIELNNSIQRQREPWQVAAGIVQGGTSGAMAGMLGGGGGYGALAGGILGAGVSAIGGAMDIKLNEMLRNEAIDYATDNFGYQLGNIRALPDTIKKVSAINNNNKIFPILEIYTCTDTEKTAFVNKIAFNGMTVMRIGTIREFINNNWTYNGITSRNYIKAQLIHIHSLDNEYHVVNTLSKELNKGIYFRRID